jgi:hypothetical protein
VAFVNALLLSIACGLAFAAALDPRGLTGPGQGNVAGGWILFPVFFGAPWLIGALLTGTVAAAWVSQAWRAGCGVIVLACGGLALGCQSSDLRFLLVPFGAAAGYAAVLAVLGPRAARRAWIAPLVVIGVRVVLALF